VTDVMVDEQTAAMPDARGVVRLDDLDEQLIGQLGATLNHHRGSKDHPGRA
jgi:hypothetical protein